jgi:hypothetical protein
MDRSAEFDLSQQNGKSPWNPSRKATARVPLPHMPAPTTCRYCCALVEIRHHDEIYGRTYGEWPWMYVCTECEARCGMHPFTAIPLGTIADAELRELRTACKPVFEAIWRYGRMSRDDAYAWLASQLGVAPELCHWGLFERHTCLHARDISRALMAHQYKGSK